MKGLRFISRYLVACILLCSWAMHSLAQEGVRGLDQRSFSEEQSGIVSDNIEVSLITCSPGKEIYAYYGHTAIRFIDRSIGVDLAFNYGLFNFDAPNFVWRFLKGETDYELGVIPYYLFLQEYSRRGSTVEEQVLNLNPSEKQNIYRSLIENLKEENRVYRYNILYDNCTIRARNIIEKSISGRLIYTVNEDQTTYREVIHRYTLPHPWSEFGQDLLLGADADKPIGRRKQEFAPFVLVKNFTHAMIVDSSGTTRPLVVTTTLTKPTTILPAEESSPLKPLEVFWAIWSVLLLVSFREIKTKRTLWGIDIIIFGLIGLAGCAVCTLFFLSEHPTVNSNWLIVILNPLPLLYLPRLIYLAKAKRKDPFYWIVGSVLVLFFAFYWVIPQKFPGAFVPLALILLQRTVTNLLTSKNKE